MTTGAFPLTCVFCRIEPATHLLVLDRAHSRTTHLVGARCTARDAERAREIAASPASMWLYELRPVPAPQEDQ